MGSHWDWTNVLTADALYGFVTAVELARVAGH